MVQYKLNYFAVRGRGEMIRLLLVDAGQEFIDNRIEFADWPALKAQAPFAQLPYLEVHQDDGKVINLAQSVTILRFLARRLGYTGGSSDLEQAITDQYADLTTDLVTELTKVHFEKDEAKKAELATKLANETLPAQLALFEKRLGENKGFLSGNSLSYADFYLFTTLEWLDEEKRNGVFQKFPNIKALDNQIRNRPRIKAYLQTRPVTAM